MSQAAASTAFVLAGGGSLGAGQVGMLKARAGIVPDCVVGASVGAINGAYYAAAPDLAGVERLQDIWLRLRSADVFPFSWLRPWARLPERPPNVPPRHVRLRMSCALARAGTSRTTRGTRPWPTPPTSSANWRWMVR